MPFPIAHESNRCSFCICCTSLSLKRPFLCIMRNFVFIFFTEIRFWVGRVVHTSTESTLKMFYLGCFRFLSNRIYGDQKVTLHFKMNHSAHVSWTLQYKRLSCAHSGQVELLCQENLLSCA